MKRQAEQLRRNLTVKQAIIILLSRIIGIGYLQFPTDSPTVCIVQAILLVFNLYSAVYSSYLILKLKCEYPKFK